MTALTWSVISFLFGLFAGHRLQLFRDKRKELMEAAAPIRAWIVRQLEHPDANLWETPSAAELDRFISRLGPIEARAFKHWWGRMLAAYHEFSELDSAGQTLYLRNDPALHALEKLKHLCRPR